MPQLIPVEHDPFGEQGSTAPKLVPVEHDPFSGIPTSAEEALQPGTMLKGPYEKIATPVIEGLGMVIGGLAGSAVNPVGGTIAGSGLGFAGGKQLAGLGGRAFGYDKTLPEELKLGTPEAFSQVKKDILAGVGYELTGQIAGKVIPSVAKAVSGVITFPFRKLGIAPTVTEKGMAAKALETFKETSKGTELTQPQIDRNIKVATELQGKIPGLKFTQGQLTNDASAISLERSLARRGGEDLSQSQREYANTILRRYWADKAAGQGNVSDLINHADTLREHLQAGSKQAEDAVKLEVQRLSGGLDEQAQGKTIIESLGRYKSVAKARASALYNRIPDIKVNTDSLMKAINDIKSDYDPVVESADNIPGRLLAGLENKIVTKQEIPSTFNVTGLSQPARTAETIRPMNFSELRKLRSQVLAEIRTAQGSATPNDQYIRRLNMLKNGVEETLNAVGNRPDRAGELYREASKYYREEYVSKFKQGTIADVLSRGRRGEDTRIALANIANKFTSLDGIDQFKLAVGNDSLARQAMHDNFAFDMVNSSRDASGNINYNKATNWLYQNTTKLKKLGLYDEFSGLSKLQNKADLASQYIDTFNKSVAGRILGSDPDTMIANTFSGSKNYGQSATELMAMVSGNKAAEAGLKKAFADNLSRQSETTGLNFFQQGGDTIADIEFQKSVAKLTNQIKKYLPAFKVIYKNEPEKLKAINNVWSAYQILNRTARSPIGGGSDTFELFGKSLDVIAGSTAPGKWYAYKTIRDMVNKFGDRGTKAFLTKAMTDPDYAAVLSDIAAGKPEKTWRTTLNLLMQKSIISGQIVHGNEVQR